MLYVKWMIIGKVSTYGSSVKSYDFPCNSLSVCTDIYKITYNFSTSPLHILYIRCDHRQHISPFLVFEVGIKNLEYSQGDVSKHTNDT